MGDDTEAERSFIFDWEILIDASIVSKSGREVNLLLSRSYIDDIETHELIEDDMSEAMDEQANITPNHEEEGEEAAPDAPVTPTTIPPIPRPQPANVVDVRRPGTDIFAEIKRLLPSISSGEGSNNNESRPSSADHPRASTAEYGQIKAQYRSSDALDFAAYWDAVGPYLKRSYDVLASGDEEAFAGMEKPPSIIIKCHKDNKHFKDLFSSLPDVSSAGGEEAHRQLYEERLKEQVAKDFVAFKAHTTKNRCLTFLAKIAKMDYSHGYATQLIHANDNGKGDPSDMADVFYESYSSAYPRKEPQIFPRCLSKGEGEGTAVGVAEEAVPVPTTTEVPAFDFNFDPKRDANLVAKKAQKFYGKAIKKYFFQRYRLFSRLNSGILMDEEGWFSVTPERIAEHIADRMVTRPECIILDAFTGVGGNAIQFALRGARVIAVDLDPVKIRCAAQNARVYEVEDRITFICGNFFDVAKALIRNGHHRIDAVFLSPPWGGPSYSEAECFDLATGITPNGFDIMEAAKKISPNICLFLPKNTSIKQLTSMAGEDGRVEVEQNVLRKKVKTISAYFGNLIAS